MNNPPPIAAARRFRDLATMGDIPSLAELLQSLDALVLAMHDMADVEPIDADQDPPERDYQAAYAAVGGRFPGLGYYATTDPLVVPPEEPTLGDAIDDIVDIAGDIEDALWLLENVGAADALWWLRFNYGIHWGGHARGLSLYLHALQPR